jgi:hypothetical protein
MQRHTCSIADEFFDAGQWLICVDADSLIGPDDHQVWVLCQRLDEDWEPTLDGLPIEYCPWCGARLAPTHPRQEP